MDKRDLGLHLAGLLVFCLSSAANATLFDRGNGMIYDSDQDLTWLQDVNYAKTSGYSSNGLMNWHQATAWVNGLVFGGYDDWRLPIVIDTGYPGADFSYSGTDAGYNVDTSISEFAYMFHVNLGNVSFRNPDKSYN